MRLGVFGKPLLNLKDFNPRPALNSGKSMVTSLLVEIFFYFLTNIKIKGTRFSCSFFVYQIFFRIFIMSSLVGTLGLVFVHLSRSAASAMALSFDSYS